jgi:hypothetical protein
VRESTRAGTRAREMVKAQIATTLWRLSPPYRYRD